MVDTGFIVIVGAFVIYYLIVLFSEKKIMSDPKEIIEKFLSILLLYAGISIVYFSLTGKPFLNDSVETYSVYIFLIGFIALIWAIPNLLEEFGFFKRFINKRGKRK